MGSLCLDGRCRCTLTNLIENLTPLSYGLRNPYSNLKSENSQGYAQKPQQNWWFGFRTKLFAIEHRFWRFNAQHAHSQLDLSLLSMAKDAASGCIAISNGSSPSDELSTPPKAGVLKKLSLACLAKLSRLRYSWLRFGLASADYCGLMSPR
jgi:hypothetical protein